MGGSRHHRHDDFHRFRAHEPHGHGLHRRSEAARRAILRAADDLLVELGFAGVTVEGIAARAGVGKQTIYRWWRSKVDVLLDCLLEDSEQELPLPDTGHIDKDLRLLLRQVSKFLTRSDAGQVLRALLGEVQHDKTIASAFRTRYVRVSRDRDRSILQRAVERGELPESLDLDAALDQLLGPVFYRVLVTGERVDQRFTDDIVARFMAGIHIQKP